MRNSTKSQRSQIKQVLHNGKSVTPGEAFLVFNCFRLAARIKELRSEGLLIDTVLKQDANGKRYASYKLSRPSADDPHECVHTVSRTCDCRHGEGCAQDCSEYSADTVGC